MRSSFGLALFFLGIVSLVAGFYLSRSLAADLAAFLESAPEGVRSIALLAGGAVAVVVGLGLAYYSARAQE